MEVSIKPLEKGGLYAELNRAQALQSDIPDLESSK